MMRAMRLSENWKEALGVFERQVLAFPVIVVLLASLSFLFGGVCSAWQWHAAVALVVLFPFFHGCRHTWRAAGVAGGLFLGMLVALFIVISFCTDTIYCNDYLDYHLPAIRFLIEGWNPVTDADMSKILSRLEMNLEDMRWWHVLFSQKAVWMFNAVAYKFHSQPFAVSLALNPFLSVSFAFAMVRLSRCMEWHWSLALLLFVGTVFVATFGTPVDDAMLYASSGLIATMLVGQKEGRLRLPELLLYSFWMMNGKTSSLLTCFAFWVVFSTAWCIRYRSKLWRNALSFVAIGAILTLGLLLASASPLITSLKDYGHPFYPFMSVDEEKHPVMDLAWPLRAREGSATDIGFWGYFANAYLSPSAVKAYYKWKTGKADFSYAYAVSPSADAPLSPAKRLTLLASLVLLLLMRPVRLAGVLFVAGLVCFSPYVFGEIRYLPWIGFMECLSAVAVLESVVRGRRYLAWMPVAAASAIVAIHLPRLFLAEVYNFGVAERSHDPSPGVVYAVTLTWNHFADEHCDEFRKIFPYVPTCPQMGHSTVNNVKLLLRELYPSCPVKVCPFESKVCDCGRMIDGLEMYRGWYFREAPEKIWPRDLSSYEKARIAFFDRLSYFLIEGLVSLKERTISKFKMP